MGCWTLGGSQEGEESLEKRGEAAEVGQPRGEGENSREREETLGFGVISNERVEGVYIVLGCLGRRPKYSPERQEIMYTRL